ncbi:IucA/IucC family C-terminal-domain containing protein, partial [Enterococcus faecalis]|uniref:IucA/IucC family C-terminal-domain containing protein n=1 Tax=Enterococcus faecalis TaxID=1351 RepID=UPI000F9E37D6
INVDQTEYASLKGVPYPYLELLGAVWRESIFRYMEQGEQAIPLSSLLHVDGEGKPFVAALLERSGLTVAAWIKRFFAVVLPPLLHYLYQYGTVFSPHGQYTIVIVKEGKPCRLAVKDYVDDVNISDQPFEELAEMDDDLKKVLRSEPPEGLT